MDFKQKYEKQLAEASAKQEAFRPKKDLWVEPNLVYTHREFTLQCTCGKWTAFRYDDGCEIPVCSEECLDAYTHREIEPTSSPEPTPEQPQPSTQPQTQIPTEGE